VPRAEQADLLSAPPGEANSVPVGNGGLEELDGDFEEGGAAGTLGNKQSFFLLLLLMEKRIRRPPTLSLRPGPSGTESRRI